MLLVFRADTHYRPSHENTTAPTLTTTWHREGERERKRVGERGTERERERETERERERRRTMSEILP